MSGGLMKRIRDSAGRTFRSLRRHFFFWLAILLLPGGGWAATIVSGEPGNLLRAQAETYANRLLSQVLTNWNLEVFVSNAHSSLWERASQDDIERAFFSYRQLGSMLSCTPATGDVAIATTLEGKESVVGVYSAHGVFQNGEADVSLVSIRNGSVWQCASFYVTSDLIGNQSDITPPDPITLARKAMNGKTDEERTRIENELLAADELTVRRRVSEIRVLAEMREAQGDRARAAGLYRAALRGTSTALDLQMKVAELQLSLGNTNEAVESALTVYRMAETPALFEQARSILESAHACPAAPTASTENLATNCEFVMVQVGSVSTQLLMELRAELQNELKIPFVIRNDPVSLPEPGRSQADLYVADVFCNITQRLTRLQFNDLLGGLGIAEAPTHFGPAQKKDFVDAYLNMLGPQGAHLRSQYAVVSSALATQYQYRSESVTERIGLQLQTDAVERIKGYLGVTDADLFSDDSNFLFGQADGEYGVVSSFRFQALNNYEPECRPRLLMRLKKQALSTVGFMMSIPRCPDPSCARAFPLSLAEHDAKSEHLCPICLCRLEAYKRNPNSWFSAVPHINQGSDQFRKQNYAAAIAEAQRAVQLCSTSTVARMNWIHSVSQSGNLAESERMVKSILQTDPSNDMYSLELASIYMQEGRREEADAVTDQVLQSNPTNIAARIQRFTTAYSAGDYDLCQRLARETITICPTSSAAYAFLAAAENSQGDYATAIAMATHALSINTNEAGAWSAMGFALSGLNRRQEALPYLARAAEAFPNDVWLWRNLGVAYAACGRMDSSVLALQRAVSLSKTNATLASDLGYTYFMMGNVPDAVKWFDQAIQLDPKMGLAYYNKALLCHATKDDAKALENLDLATKAGYPGSPQFRAAVESAVRRPGPQNGTTP